MQEQSRLREALAVALAAAQEAHAPERVLALLRGAYRSLDSSRFVDDDRVLASELRISRVDVVTSRSATLEAFATQSPTAVVFDLDARELVPTVEMLGWLATEFPQIRRLGCAEATGAFMVLRERGLYHAVLPKPPTREQLATALPLPSDTTTPRP